MTRVPCVKQIPHHCKSIHIISQSNSVRQRFWDRGTLQLSFRLQYLFLLAHTLIFFSKLSKTAELELRTSLNSFQVSGLFFITWLQHPSIVFLCHSLSQPFNYRSPLATSSLRLTQCVSLQQDTWGNVGNDPEYDRIWREDVNRLPAACIQNIWQVTKSLKSKYLTFYQPLETIDSCLNVLAKLCRTTSLAFYCPSQYDTIYNTDLHEVYIHDTKSSCHGLCN